MADIRNDVMLEATRMLLFLRNNQLVQANAVAQKLEGVLKDKLASDINEKPESKIEELEYWAAFRHVMRIKTSILGGNASAAIKDVEGIIKSLN